MDSIESKKIGPSGHPPTVVYFIDGTKFYMHFKPLSKFFLDPAMVRFFLAAWAIWVLFQQRIAEFSTSEWPPFIMYIMLGFVVMGTMILATVMAIKVTSFFGQSFIYTPMVSIPMIVAHDLSEWLMVRFFIPNPEISVADFLLRLLQNFGAVCLLDYFYGQFVAPKMDRSVAIPAAKPVKKVEVPSQPLPPSLDPPPPQISKPKPAPEEASKQAADEPAELPLTILLQGEKVQLSKLKKINAEDHYLRIFEGSKSKLVRGKFSDAIKEIPRGLGIQISRSQWVARKHIVLAERGSASKLFVRLNDGEIAPVARSRRNEVTAKLAKWAIDTTRQAGKK